MMEGVCNRTERKRVKEEVFLMQVVRVFFGCYLIYYTQKKTEVSVTKELSNKSWCHFRLQRKEADKRGVLVTPELLSFSCVFVWEGLKLHWL
jgi:hypothetical protein